MSPLNNVPIKNNSDRSSIKIKLFPVIRAAVCPSAPFGTADRLLSIIDELLFASRRCETEPSGDKLTRQSLAPIDPSQQDFGSLRRSQKEREIGPKSCKVMDFSDQLRIPKPHESPACPETLRCASLSPSPRVFSPLHSLTRKYDPDSQSNGFLGESLTLDCKWNPAEHNNAPKLNDTLPQQVNTGVDDIELSHLALPGRSCSPGISPIELSPLPFLPSLPRRKLRRSLNESRSEPIITRSMSKKKKSGANGRQS